jgi:hypothetical protein
MQRFLRAACERLLVAVGWTAVCGACFWLGLIFQDEQMAVMGFFLFGGPWFIGTMLILFGD